MLIAYNNDVEYKSRWYHIQTEDNGIRDGHITTTVFYSGQILDSKSISYKDAIQGLIDEDQINAVIKDKMIKQHQQYYARLFEGQYDGIMQQKLSGHPSISGHPAISGPQKVSGVAPAIAPPASKPAADSAVGNVSANINTSGRIATADVAIGIRRSSVGGSPVPSTTFRSESVSDKKANILRASQQLASVEPKASVGSLGKPGFGSGASSMSAGLVRPKSSALNASLGNARKPEVGSNKRAWRGVVWINEDLALDGAVLDFLAKA